MFHASVVESDAFLDLPVGAQALYFHLGMQADDDGFVNGPKQIARKLRRPPRELKALIDAGFLFDFDGIVVLKHWRMANNWKTDRLQLPRHPEIARKLFLKPSKEYTISRIKGQPNLYKLKKNLILDHGIQTDSQKRIEENRKEEKKIEKNKREKSRGEESAQAEDFPAPDDIEKEFKYLRGKLGKGVVLLTEEQMSDLLDKMGLDAFDFYVEKLSDFILRKQATVTNHYATLLKWWQEDKGVIL